MGAPDHNAYPPPSWAQPQPTPYTILNSNPFDSKPALVDEASPSAPSSESASIYSVHQEGLSAEEGMASAKQMSQEPNQIFQGHVASTAEDAPCPSLTAVSPLPKASQTDLHVASQSRASSTQPAPQPPPASQHQQGAHSTASGGAVKLVGDETDDPHSPALEDDPHSPMALAESPSPSLARGPLGGAAAEAP